MQKHTEQSARAKEERRVDVGEETNAASHEVINILYIKNPCSIKV